MAATDGGLPEGFLDKVERLRALGRFKETHGTLLARSKVSQSSRSEVLLLRQISQTYIAQGHITQADSVLREALSFQVPELTPIESALLNLQHSFTSLFTSSDFSGVAKICEEAKQGHLIDLNAASCSKDQVWSSWCRALCKGAKFAARLHWKLIGRSCLHLRGRSGRPEQQTLLQRIWLPRGN